jgi:catechol 2,3-dioxygenase-like lactoylglutathione lyase family enzyme
MDHVGIVVEDLDAAIEFFVELGLEQQGRGSVEGDWVGRVIGLEDVRAEIAMLEIPGGEVRLELARFRSPTHEGGGEPEPANAPGIRHLTLVVDDLEQVVAGLRERGTELIGAIENYRDVYKLCYVRGPEGIIVELTERIG